MANTNAEIIALLQTDPSQAIRGVLGTLYLYNPATVNDLIEKLNEVIVQGGFEAIVVDELPETGQNGTVYFVPNGEGAPNSHDEYVWVAEKNAFELIGTTQVDLADYVKNTDYATTSTGGVIKVNTSNYGIGVSSGYLIAPAKTLEQYSNANQNCFIGKGTLENIKYDLVKRAVTTNNITLTDDEKTAARTWIGAVGNTDYATSVKAGILTPSSYYATAMSGQYFYAQTKTLDAYKDGVNGMFIGKGTLENVLAQYATAQYVDEKIKNASGAEIGPELDVELKLTSWFYGFNSSDGYFYFDNIYGAESPEDVSCFALTNQVYSGSPNISIVNRSYGISEDGQHYSFTEEWFGPGEYWPKNLGRDIAPWQTVYATKLNNGADLELPTEGGTLARLEDIDAVVGDISTALTAILGE